MTALDAKMSDLIETSIRKATKRRVIVNSRLCTGVLIRCSLVGTERDSDRPVRISRAI